MVRIIFNKKLVYKYFNVYKNNNKLIFTSKKPLLVMKDTSKNQMLFHEYKKLRRTDNKKFDLKDIN
jgi:hypothetical protein